MARNKIALSCLIVLLCLTLFISLAKGQIITNDERYFSLTNGEAYGIQTQNLNALVFTVTDGNLTGFASINTADTGGSLTVTPEYTGSLTFTIPSNCTLYLNGAKLVGDLVRYSSASFTVSWIFLQVTPQYPATLNVMPFWQYLFSGNLLGFFQAIFLWSFILQDILVGAICMLFLVPIYIKTKSLLLLSILWILLGSSFIVAMPAVSGLAIIFLILGVGSVFWKLVHPN
jgi:hypothetical protein